MNTPTFIFMNGKGCSGKTTQSLILKRELGDTAIEISTGDLFRDALTGKGEYGRFHDKLAPYAEAVNKKGGFIPDEVIVGIVATVVAEKLEEGIETFVFTGFPRTAEQLKLVDEMVKNAEGQSYFLFYDVSDEVSRERAVYRRETDIREGRTPRDDDDPQVVTKRLNKYRESTYPMLLKLDQEGRLIYVNAEKSIPEIEMETRHCLLSERV